MKDEYIATELNENSEATDNEYNMVSDTAGTGEDFSSVNDFSAESDDTQSDFSSTEDSTEDKELAVTELNSYTIDDLYNTQSQILVETQKSNELNGGLLLSAIIFIGVSFAWALGKWFYNVVRC